jgi:hypothetical protein
VQQCRQHREAADSSDQVTWRKCDHLNWLGNLASLPAANPAQHRGRLRHTDPGRSAPPAHLYANPLVTTRMDAVVPVRLRLGPPSDLADLHK